MKALPPLAIAAHFIVFSIAAAHAAIPRDTELALQRKAPEQLQIEVVSVEKKRRGTSIRISAKAKVLEVKASASGLKDGATITIQYSVPSVPIAGAPPSVVDKGDRHSAFLRKEEGADHFEPAAASGSFDDPGE